MSKIIKNKVMDNINDLYPDYDKPLVIDEELSSHRYEKMNSLY